MKTKTVVYGGVLSSLLISIVLFACTNADQNTQGALDTSSNQSSVVGISAVTLSSAGLGFSSVAGISSPSATNNSSTKVSSTTTLNTSSSVKVSSSSSLSSSSKIVAASSSSYVAQVCGSGVMPTPVTGGSNGYGTRYWDCCKPACSWKDKTTGIGAPNGINKTCNVNNQEMSLMSGTTEITSGCDAGGVGYTCYSQAPWAVCDKLAYGFAAVPGNSPQCGKCFQLDFTGTGKYDNGAAPKAAAKSLKGKTMIVMASNIGYDVAGGQFDIMIPGGGVGAFSNGCPVQWSTTDASLLGNGSGGLLTACQSTLGYDATVAKYQTCLMDKCTALFGRDAKYADLLAGCKFFANWFNTADNPNFTYKEVTCPAELVNKYKNVL